MKYIEFNYLLRVFNKRYILNLDIHAIKSYKNK